MADTEEHAEVMMAVQMADYFAFKNYNDLLKGILQRLDSLGVTIDILPPHLKERIEFFGFRQMLATHTRSSMGHLLVSFDELTKQWGERADKKGVPLLQWQTWRYKIAMQMGLDILRTYLELPHDHEAFVRPDTIHLPAKFDFNQYKKSLDEMFKDINENGRKNTVSAKTEHMHADMVRKALLDVLNDNGQLFKYKLYYIFNGNTTTQFRRELGAFVDEIESLVLDAPVMLQKPVVASPAALEPEKKSEEWGLQDREVRGPYGVEAASSSSAAPVAQTQSPPSKKDTPKKVVAKGSVPKPSPDVVGARLTRRRARQIDEEEAEEKPAMSKKSRKVKRIEPVTEAFTQFEDGFDDVGKQDEVADVVVDSQGTQGTIDIEHAETLHRTRGAAAAALDNLKSARENYVRNRKHDDPLDEVMGESPAAVVSRAVGSRKVATPMSPLTESPAPPTASSAKKKKSPVRKGSLIGERASAQTVSFNDSASTSDASILSTPNGKIRTMNIAPNEKKKFARSIEEKEVPRKGPVFAGGQRRVAWSIEEEDALIAGINRHGIGKWKEILNDPNLRDKFRDRTNVQLKDKHRNMVNAGQSFE